MESNTKNINELTRLASSSCVRGQFVTSDDVRIDGRCEGIVCSTGRVVVGEGACIKGDIICNCLELQGTVEGNIYVKESLNLKSPSSVKGDLRFKKFTVEIGADFVGNCDRIDDAEFEEMIKKYCE